MKFHKKFYDSVKLDNNLMAVLVRTWLVAVGPLATCQGRRCTRGVCSLAQSTKYVVPGVVQSAGMSPGKVDIRTSS